ncbi:MAG: YdcF family protein [Sedimentisphaerales bacterium]|nr:YdcF family protein [Sedimentisphaerales bacterium]
MTGMVVAKSLAAPVMWVLILLAIGLGLSRWKRRTSCPAIGWWAVLAGMLVLLGFSLRPVSELLTYSLESRYAPAAMEELRGLDVLVILGGGLHASGGLRTQADLAGPAHSRAYHGIRLFNESGAGLLALCGGGFGEQADSEAEAMKAMALQMGVSQDRILTETRSLNTRQNAAFLADLLPRGTGRRIALVTSATHMLRSQRVFRRQFPDDVIVPVPVNYTYDSLVWSPRTFLPSVDALQESTIALHEWFGLLWCSLRDR